MSRNLLLVGGGVLAVVLIVGFLLPTMQQSSGFNFGYSVIGEDENGSPVTIPFSWWIAGVEVTGIRPTATWTCSGDGLDWSTLEIVGEFSVFRLDYQGRTATDITPGQTGRAFLKSGIDAKEDMKQLIPRIIVVANA